MYCIYCPVYRHVYCSPFEYLPSASLFRARLAERGSPVKPVGGFIIISAISSILGSDVLPFIISI